MCFQSIDMNVDIILPWDDWIRIFDESVSFYQKKTGAELPTDDKYVLAVYRKIKEMIDTPACYDCNEKDEYGHDLFHIVFNYDEAVTLCVLTKYVTDFKLIKVKLTSSGSIGTIKTIGDCIFEQVLDSLITKLLDKKQKHTAKVSSMDKIIAEILKEEKNYRGD